MSNCCVQELLAPWAGLAFNQNLRRIAQEPQLIPALEEPPENAGHVRIATVFETATSEAVGWHRISQETRFYSTTGHVNRIRPSVEFTKAPQMQLEKTENTGENNT